MHENNTEGRVAFYTMTLGAARANMVRYYLLYHKGSVWINIGMVPIAPIVFPRDSPLVLVVDGEIGSGIFVKLQLWHPSLSRQCSCVRWQSSTTTIM
jgi:mannosyltransferase OCH1-like enzyme